MNHTLTAAIVVSLSLIGRSAGAQAPPPLLSTMPTPPTGAIADPGQMSGRPLQVADLPPGTVSVRVIRQTFSHNVANQRVELHVAGTAAPRVATTDAAGRAIFSGIAAGASVFARAVVEGEALTSEQFNGPEFGGVRLVLVAGGSAAAAAFQASSLSADPREAMPLTAGATSGAAMPTDGVPWPSFFFATLTVGTGTWWLRGRGGASRR